jgi:hypothetical protein
MCICARWQRIFSFLQARNLTFQDLISQRFGNMDSLNHLQYNLREFVDQRVLQGETPTPENIARGVDRLIREMRPHFDIMVCSIALYEVKMLTLFLLLVIESNNLKHVLCIVSTFTKCSQIVSHGVV